MRDSSAAESRPASFTSRARKECSDAKISGIGNDIHCGHSASSSAR